MVSISVMLGCNTNKDNNSFIVLDYDEYKSDFRDVGWVPTETIFSLTYDTIGYLFDSNEWKWGIKPIYKNSLA